MIERAARRPVAVLMATAALAALGIPSALRMPLELLPDVSFPRLAIVASWSGGSPEMVEARVTAPIERAAQRVRGVRSVASTSYPQRAEVTVEFEPGTDMEFARLALSEELAALTPTFPPGVSRPEIQPWVPEEFAVETRALLVWTMAGPGDPGALRDLATDVVRPALLAVDGVDAVEVAGGTDSELRVELDPARLAALGISPDQVTSAIAGGLEIAETGATVESRGRAWTVTLEDRAGSAADVEALVVRAAAVDSASGDLRPAVLLGELGRARVARARPAWLHRVDGRSAVTVSLYRAAGSNAVRVADGARERAAEIEAGALPAGHRLLLDRDGSERIADELADLATRAAVAAAVVLAVLLVAFRRLRPALLAFGAIGASVAVALAVMGWSGLSLNLLTLGGLAMGLGLVVDNAIVVLESGERRRARGEPAGTAAAEGAREVALPLLAATATTGIVFLPFLYFQGELRAYYVPFAATVAIVLGASLLVSLLAVPAAVTALARRGARPRPEETTPRPRPLAERAYRSVLAPTIGHPKTTAVAAFLLLAVSLWLFWDRVPRGRTWAGFGDVNYLAIQVQMPRGAELERTDAIVRGLEREVAAIPTVKRFTTRVGPEYGSIRIDFPDSLQTTYVPLAVKEQLVARSHRFGGADVRVYGFGSSFYGGGGAPPTYRLEIRGYAYHELEAIAEDLAARLERYPRIRDVDPNATGHWFERDRETELALVPRRASLDGYGMSVEDLLARVSAYARGRLSSDVVSIGGEEMDLSLKLAGADSADVAALSDLVVTTAEGRPVRVADVATIEERETMARIVREDQRYQRGVVYEFRGPPKLGDAVRDAVVASTALPPGYEILTERGWWQLAEGESRQIGLVLALAVALVFLVTAALFESLRAPLVVLAAVPLALVGVAALWLATGDTFTREAWIGVVMMSGIVVNNAILVVDRIGALRREGLALAEAALEGTLQRVRPVLMTTATTVLGLLPFVLFPGSAESGLWRSLAMATIGGLLASTVLVLVLIPSLYGLLSGSSDVRKTIFDHESWPE